MDYSFFTEPVSCEVHNDVGGTNVSTLVDVHCEWPQGTRGLGRGAGLVGGQTWEEGPPGGWGALPSPWASPALGSAPPLLLLQSPLASW